MDKGGEVGEEASFFQMNAVNKNESIEASSCECKVVGKSEAG